MRSSKTVWSVLGSVIFVMSMAGMYACGQDTARRQAFAQLNELKGDTLGGDEAVAKAAQLRQTLQDGHGLKLADINETDAAVATYVANAWVRTAHADALELYQTSSDPQKAENLLEAIKAAREKSGKTFEQIRLSERALKQHVARNDVEHMRKVGGNPTVAMLQAAGYEAPVVVKTRTRTIIKRVPVKQVAARKVPAAKPKPRT